jgi:hypothetical protein
MFLPSIIRSCFTKNIFQNIVISITVAVFGVEVKNCFGYNVYTNYVLLVLIGF